MVNAMSLTLVRDELFATIEEAEQRLEQFIVERHNGSLLQLVVDNLQQVRGILSLIELAGAELLALEVLQQTMDIPVGVGQNQDGQLAALSNALHILRRYLESVDVCHQGLPELLLPAVNELRQAAGSAPLPESQFFSIHLDVGRPVCNSIKGQEIQADEVARLRHMYQIGLLGFIREQGVPASIGLMVRAMSRLDRIFAGQPQGRLFWVCAAALEAQLDGRLSARKSRKYLFARVERELKQSLACSNYEAPQSMLRELLYLVALTESCGPRVKELREVFGLQALPFTDRFLEKEYLRLAGPGRAVMRSLSSAIREELAGIKDAIDFIARGCGQEEHLSGLQISLGRLAKTLTMVGLISAGNLLQGLLPTLVGQTLKQPLDSLFLARLAEALLHVEGVVAGLESGERSLQPEQEADCFARHQLTEARIVVLDEAKASLALAKRAIVAYLESQGERIHLANVPISLDAVRGGLWFLGLERAASLIGACAEYIQSRMLDSQQIPAEPMLETLADALTSLEYYLEGGAPDAQLHILDLASDTLCALTKSALA
ncbi:ferrous iron transporter B [Azotobacter chroococcum]|uniref:ferrous iron transporter B n=1 Tax=Azotobacter chroococcum TaxID=353 RepID=UPI000B612715|nr:ferrous iron transporter B [Azotobacter chroococcum]ASL26486.1 ferrous iron transporter B [Azotobacter chroococcum]